MKLYISYLENEKLLQTPKLETYVQALKVEYQTDIVLKKNICTNNLLVDIENTLKESHCVIFFVSTIALARCEEEINLINNYRKGNKIKCFPIFVEKCILEKRFKWLEEIKSNIDLIKHPIDHESDLSSDERIKRTFKACVNEIKNLFYTLYKLEQVFIKLLGKEPVMKLKKIIRDNNKPLDPKICRNYTDFINSRIDYSEKRIVKPIDWEIILYLSDIPFENDTNYLFSFISHLIKEKSTDHSFITELKKWLKKYNKDIKNIHPYEFLENQKLIQIFMYINQERTHKNNPPVLKLETKIFYDYELKEEKVYKISNEVDEVAVFDKAVKFVFDTIKHSVFVDHLEFFLPNEFIFKDIDQKPYLFKNFGIKFDIYIRSLEKLKNFSEETHSMWKKLSDQIKETVITDSNTYVADSFSKSNCEFDNKICAFVYANNT